MRENFIKSERNKNSGEKSEGKVKNKVGKIIWVRFFSIRINRL
jgi:uncharacterized protein YjbJ (UPF0337 family)